MKFSRNVNNGLRNRLNSGGFWRDVDLSPSKIKGHGLLCPVILYYYIWKWQSERSDCFFTWETLYLLMIKNVYLSKVVLWTWSTVVTQLCCGTWDRNLGVGPRHSHGASVCWSAWATGRWRTWQQACDNALRGWTCCQYVFHPPHPPVCCSGPALHHAGCEGTATTWIS